MSNSVYSHFLVLCDVDPTYHFDDLAKLFMQSCLIYPTFRIFLCVLLHADWFLNHPQDHSHFIIVLETETVTGMSGLRGSQGLF